MILKRTLKAYWFRFKCLFTSSWCRKKFGEMGWDYFEMDIYKYEYSYFENQSKVYPHWWHYREWATPEMKKINPIYDFNVKSKLDINSRSENNS